MRKTILIVDDDATYRKILGKLFIEEYHVVYADNGKDAIREIGLHMQELAMILLDLEMPVLGGFQVLQLLSAKGITNKIPVLMVTGEEREDVKANCYKLGAMEIINKPFTPHVVYERVTEFINLFENVGLLEGQLKKREDELELQKRKMEEFNSALIEAISNIVEFRDTESGVHVKRVKFFTRIIAEHYQKMFPDENLTDMDIDNIEAVSVVHDIGKVTIPDAILLKPGKLIGDEIQVMRSHTTKGCEIIQYLSEVQNQEQLKLASDICRHHHERHDGSGYPDRLRGEEISIGARIVSVADVYDALLSERAYKKAFSREKAYQMIMDGECGVFHPRLIQAFEDAREDLEQCANEIIE